MINITQPIAYAISADGACLQIQKLSDCLKIKKVPENCDDAVTLFDTHQEAQEVCSEVSSYAGFDSAIVIAIAL